MSAQFGRFGIQPPQKPAAPHIAQDTQQLFVFFVEKKRSTVQCLYSLPPAGTALPSHATPQGRRLFSTTTTPNNSIRHARIILTALALQVNLLDVYTSLGSGKTTSRLWETSECPRESAVWGHILVRRNARSPILQARLVFAGQECRYTVPRKT